MQGLNRHSGLRGENVESLSQRVFQLQDALSHGEAVYEDDVQSLMTEIRDALPSMNADEVEQLKGQVDTAIELLMERKEQAALKLRQIRKGKSALNGYSHIRGYQTSQKLNRQA